MPWGLFVSTVDVLGWGRGGLQGVGSSVIGVGGEILYWDNPIYLMDVGRAGGLGSWGLLVADGPSLLRGGSCFFLISLDSC